MKTPLYVKPPKAARGAANRHTRITRGKGPTASNPAGMLSSMKKMGGMKGNDGGSRQC